MVTDQQATKSKLLYNGMLLHTSLSKQLFAILQFLCKFKSENVI